jgi:acyl-coenzyme A thioesterase PaaI-like protein
MLESGRCEGHIAHRRRVTNHIGTVHAIALCNLAELTAGLMVDASLPKGMRWIPKGMVVKYLAKATGTQHAVATPAQAIVSAEAGYALPVNVQVRDTAGTMVFEARIDMWVSPIKRG